MAWEVHPVPFRTRKLSPLAPMVLRSSPWESRTSLTNEGHLRAEGPVTRVVAGPSFVWAQGARAPASRRRRVPLGCPFDHVSGAASGPSGSSGDATCRVRQAIAPRHLARWRGAFVTSRNAAFRQRPRSFGTKRRAPSMPEAPLRDAKAPLARRASPRVEPGRSSSHGLRPSLEQGGATHDVGPPASL